MSREARHNLLQLVARALAADWRCGGRCPPYVRCVPANHNPPSLERILELFRGILLMCGCVLVLGGCVHQTKAQFTRHYALGGSAPMPTAQSTAPNPDGRILQVSRIIVPEWLAGAAMYYRLDYRQDGRLSAYANSDWIAPPATLLEPIVEEAIAAGGAWRAVLGPRNPATADASLHLQLDDFSQAFAQPDQSAGVIDATATLIDNHDDHVIDQKHFHIEVAAPTPDAQGGVKALRDASRKLAVQLQAWLQEADRRREQ